jgi:hypothetical protein
VQPEARPEEGGAKVKSEEKKWEGESCWKSGGDECVFIPGEGPLADEVGFDAMPDTARGEGGHGVTKPQGVAHRHAVTIPTQKIHT